MDYVMMNFHKDRMKTINGIVRSLWRQIYRGNDIDHIEIKAEESVTSSTGKITLDFETENYYT